MEVLPRIRSRIDEALGQNRRDAGLIAALLVAMFVVALGLILYGAAVDQWAMIAPGGLLQILILFPVRRLTKLREGNLMLQVVPDLLVLLEDTPEGRAMAVKMIEKLIERV